MAARDFTTLRPEDLCDIQGIILLDYNMPLVRHFLVKVKQPHEARRLLGALAVQKDPPGLCITNSEDLRTIQERKYCLNVGLTYEGLKALGLPTTVLESFAPTSSFVTGATARAWKVGDKNKNAPEYWWTDKEQPGLPPSDIHMLLSLYVQGDTSLEGKADELKDLFQRDGQVILQPLYEKDGAYLPDQHPDKPGKSIHFGFKDGISQPQIKGAPPPGPAGLTQAEVSPGAFLFGYASQWTGFRYPVPRPVQFGRNGSFAVFRVMQQHVDEFDAYLKKTAQKETEQGKKISEEEVAARLCGRKPNGDPLVGTRNDDINKFDYVNDPEGKVPFDSHIRRTNPRGEKIAGNDANKHPIIRRGMPYQVDNPDKKERGLLGLFIGISIEDQFEFIMQNWMNKGGFHQKVPTQSVDPFLSFITTRGCAYCFLPSLTALEYIASI